LAVAVSLGNEAARLRGRLEGATILVRVRVLTVLPEARGTLGFRIGS